MNMIESLLKRLYEIKSEFKQPGGAVCLLTRVSDGRQ